jgi:hypothetical protein
VAQEGESSYPGVGSPERAPSGLTWGIKGSFLAYLRRMPDLKSSMTQGAGTSERGFFFPLDSAEEYDAASGQGTLRFGGDFRISGHHGMLFVMFVRPWVAFDGNRATLSIAEPDSYPALDQRLPLLDLDVLPYREDMGARMWTALPATLRPEAVDFFNEAYPAGEAFDAVDVRVEF